MLERASKIDIENKLLMNVERFFVSRGFNIDRVVIYGTQQFDLVAKKGEQIVLIETKNYPKVNRIVLAYDAIVQVANRAREYKHQHQLSHVHPVIVGMFNLPGEVRAASKSIGVSLVPVKDDEAVDVNNALDSSLEFLDSAQDSFHSFELGENFTTEFKSTLRWDVKEGKENKELEKEVAKTIAAFMNTDGGIIVIGVTDDHRIYGIENDLITLRKKNPDGFLQQLGNVLSNYLGGDITPFYHSSIERHEGKYICIVQVDPSPKPVFFNEKCKSPEFYIRVDNTSRPLNVENAVAYSRKHWSKYGD